MSLRAAILSCLLLVASFSAGNPAKTVQSAAPPPKGIWVTGYLEAWNLAGPKSLPINAIDFAPLTHIVYFALVPTPDGGLDTKASSITDDNANAVSAAAHAAQRKAIVCVGGADSGPAYEGAISDGNRDKFVAAIVDWAASHNYDGVDVDMEPVLDSDIPHFQAFVKALRTALKAKSPDSLMTAAAGGDEWKVYSGIQDQFDQINVMTYDFSGPWEGWETWFNSPLFNNDKRNFMSNGKPLPCIETTMQAWTAAGFDTAKIGIGAAFYGDQWTGATAPNQSIAGVKVQTLNYNDLIQQFYSKDRYHWDRGANCPYLSITGPNKTDQQFISYDDERLCREKVRFIRRHHFGGVIIWQLAGDYFPNNPPGQQQPLLSALYDEAKK